MLRVHRVELGQDISESSENPDEGQGSHSDTDEEAYMS